MIDLVFRNSTGHKEYKEDFFLNILNSASKQLKLKEKAEASVNLAGDKKIRELNSEYRGKNKATDVLSFPLEDKKQQKYDILQLGDIFISPSFVKKQAKRYKIPYCEEMARVCIHGFLHLLGYDHEKSAKEEKRMINLQEKIIKKLEKAKIN